MPPASAMLRLLAFAVPSALAAAGVQPLLGAAAGAVSLGWAVGLAAPAVIAAAVVFGADPVAGRVRPRGRRGDVHLRRARGALVDHLDDVGPPDRRLAALDSRDGPRAKRLTLIDQTLTARPSSASCPHRLRGSA